MELKDLHEEVFKFLLEKRKADPSLRYTLRSNDRNDKLSDNYWFLMSGNPQSLYLSFWQAYPFSGYNVLSLPTIRFEIKVDGKCVLYIRETNPNYTPLWNSIADALSLKQTKREDRWEKEYSTNDFKINLEHFISIERPYLNSFFKLKDVENAYPPIGEVDFLARFSKIQNLRSGKKEAFFINFIENRLIVEGLQLTNINIFKSLNLSFEKQVTCFVGGNGSGKTTILRAIALSLVGSSNFKINEIPLLTIVQAEGQRIYNNNGNITVFYRLNKNEKINEVNFVGLDTGRTFKANGQNGILKEDDFLDALVIGFAQQTKSDKYELNPEYSPNIKDLRPLILNKSDNRFDEFQNWLKKLLDADIQNDRESNLLIINEIISVINNITDDNIELDSNKTEIFVKTNRNNRGLPLNLLSQGYGQTLPMIDGDKINFKDLPAVCLIDEIDTYLHPDWQYSILKGLVESFPNVQFFITSHSPFVLTSVPSDKITIYEIDTEGGENKDKVVVHEILENLYGADIRRATKEISEERLPNILHELANIDELIEKNELKEAEDKLNVLDISKSDIAYILAQRKIQVKKLSVRK